MVWRRLDYELISEWEREAIEAHPMNSEAATRYVIRRILSRGASERLPMLARLARQQIRDRVSRTLDARYRAVVGRPPKPKPKPKLVPKPPPAKPRRRALDLEPPPRRRTRPKKV